MNIGIGGSERKRLIALAGEELRPAAQIENLSSA
jgi:hypothetical protein